jgi:hypothetical protein
MKLRNVNMFLNGLVSRLSTFQACADGTGFGCGDDRVGAYPWIEDNYHNKTLARTTTTTDASMSDAGVQWDARLMHQSTNEKRNREII